MNDDFAELENELRSFQPLRPSVALEERLAKAFAAPEPKTPAIPWWQQLGFCRPVAAIAWGLATPAAAVCAVLLLHPGIVAGTSPAASIERRSSAPSTVAANSTAEAPAATGGFEPAASSDVVYQTNDEGVVYDSEQQPSRQVRYRSNETLAWRNPNTGTQVEVSYPREDVVLTPISVR